MKIKSNFLVGIDNFIVYKQPTKSEVLKPLIDLYDKEMNQIITDNVNLCYVAMTRPVERLYIQNDYESKKFGEMFHETLLSSGLGKEKEDGLYVEINDGDRTITTRKKELNSLFALSDANTSSCWSISFLILLVTPLVPPLDCLLKNLLCFGRL